MGSNKRFITVKRTCARWCTCQMIKPDNKNSQDGAEISKTSKLETTQNPDVSHPLSASQPPDTSHSPDTSTQAKPIDHSLLNKAEKILDSLLNDYGNNVEVIFGRQLTQTEITKKYHHWAERNNLLKTELVSSKKQQYQGNNTENGVNVVSKRKNSSVLSCLPELQFSTEIICSAKLLTNGPQRKVNRPENRSYKLIVRADKNEDSGQTQNTNDNLFVRLHSFDALLDHELGTHFFRMLNEGLQPWYSDRKKFNLSESKSYDMLKSEEGLAAIHTTLKMPTYHLFFPAILYITGCYYQRTNYDTFSTVKKLTKYCDNKEFCYRLVKRAQKKLVSHDQAYLIGALEILENRKNIDFEMLMCGRLGFNELDRIKRVTRKFGVRLPDFMRDLRAYKRQLDRIAEANFVD